MQIQLKMVEILVLQVKHQREIKSNYILGWVSTSGQDSCTE